MVRANRHKIHNPNHQNLLFAQSGRCFYCGGWISSKTCTRDHLIPQLKGGHKRSERRGRDAYMNIVLACKACNRAKGARQPQASDLDRARKMYASLGKPAFEIG